MAEYRNPYQWNDQVVDWSLDLPKQSPWGETLQVVNPGYISGLLSLDERVRSGQATPEERQEYEAQAAAARAIPMRDPSSLQFGWNNDEVGSWNEGGSDWWRMINGSSPDLGPVMLSIADRIAQGTATPQERQLLEQTRAYDTDWNLRASLPQPSDAFSVLGNDLFGPLSVLALGATGGLAAAPLFAGGAGLATTLGSLGTLSGIAGTGAGVLGGATGQEWLSKLGLGLGAAGGVLGGLGGLSSLWGTGVQSLSDAAKLASGVGKITGAVGSASGNDALRQASRYLGQAGQLGQFGAGVLPSSFTDWSGSNSPLAANVAPNVQNLLSAADVATQRGGGGMEMDWLDFETGPGGYGFGGDVGAYSSPDYFQSPAYQAFTGWGGDETQTGWYQGADLDTSGGGGGNWLSSVLGGLGGLKGLLGPAVSTLGSLGAGAIGSNAAGDAARLQAAATNRALSLQEAQWLQQQQNLAPYLQAGQQGLAQLQQLAGREQPRLLEPLHTISGIDYALPGTTPGWTPQHYQGPQAVNAVDYRWTPGQGPRAQDYRYTPGAVPTLSGQDLLANDPGVAFRLGEGRKALEASAAAKGGLLSGGALAALQRQGQELSSQEYGQAWNRASQQAQLREQWNQTAQQMGFSQAQAEAAWREQMAQQASAQGFQQALAGQGQAWQQGLAGQQWNQRQQQQYETDMYNRMLQQSQLRYGQDVAQNQQDYARQQAQYGQRLAQYMLPWEQQSTLANLGGQAVGMYGQQGQGATTAISNLLGQLGTAQAGGVTNPANAWMNALSNVNTGIQGGLQNATYQQGIQAILAGLNR